MSDSDATLPRIMLVDDSRAASQFLKKALCGKGYDIHVINDAKTGLELVREIKPDVILTDYEMPDIDGPEFCRQIKAHVDTHHIPIAMLTSKEDKNHILAGVNAGADEYFLKSADLDIIDVKIRAMLRLKALHDQLQEFGKLETMRQLLVTLKHEINNPLTIAIGAADILIDTENERQKKLAEKVKLALDRVRLLLGKVGEYEAVILKEHGGKTIIDLHGEDQKIS